MKVGTAELLFVALGEMRAALDLMQLDEKTMELDGERITVTLPPCKIPDAKFDVARSYVYDIRRSLVLSPEAQSLQSVAERQALEEIQATAVQAGLLNQAEKQARMLIRCFLEAAGFRTVTFREAAQPNGMAGSAGT